MSLAALHERLGQPRLRGVSHVYAFCAAAASAAALVAIPVALIYNIFLDRFIAGFTLGAVKG